MHTEVWQSLVYCSCLENSRGVKTSVGSNPTASAPCVRSLVRFQLVRISHYISVVEFHARFWSVG